MELLIFQRLLENLETNNLIINYSNNSSSARQNYLFKKDKRTFRQRVDKSNRI